MAKRGFHQSSEVFTREINANPSPVAINTPEGLLSQWWSLFCEAFSSRFPGVSPLATESFDKVALMVENVVSNINPVNPSYPPNHTGANISNVMVSSPMMLSPHLMATPPVMASNRPDLMDPNISDLLSSIGTNTVPNLSPPTDMTSMLQFLELSEVECMLPSASNSRNPMRQISTVPAREDRHGISLGRPIQREPNLHAPKNTLLPRPEPSDAANNNRSLQQASYQGGPSDGIGSVSPVISHQVVRPTVIVPTQMQQEQVNQLRMQSSDMSGRKRKTSLSSLTAVGKERATFVNDNIDSQFSQADAVLISATNSIYALRESLHIQSMQQEGIAFKEIGSLRATKRELLSCHFHSHGKLLAAAGHERKVVIWDLEKNEVSCGEGHAHHITDIRFRPNSTMFATSSFDRTVMIWDAAKSLSPFQNLVGHAEHVMSTDFHPTKMDLLGSCDSKDEIRLWDVNRGDCKLIFKGGSRQVRFQPRLGNLLACSTGNIINIFDVDTNSIQQTLQGHVNDIRSICWDMSGMYMASVSEDSARMWSVKDGKCIHELCSGGNKFQSCTFHPGHGQLLVIGSHELLELWNPIYQSNVTWPHQAHDGIISSLADSPPTGMIASVSHDQLIKLWQ